MRLTRRLVAAATALTLLAGPAAHSQTGDAASWVDPFIGTLGAGFVFPGPAAPHGMVQLSPDTEGYFAYTGYQWGDTAIRGFSHVHVQSMGVPEGGNLPFMPTTGDVVTEVMDYQSPFSHAAEEAEAGYYRVLLARYGIDAELTAGTRVGVHRYTFPPVEQGNVLLDIGRQVPGGDLNERGQRTAGTNRARITIAGPDLVTGSANIDRAAPHGYTVHFAARFDRPFAGTGVWPTRGAPLEHGTSVEGVGAGAAVTFDAREDRDVVVKVGISFVSVANALANLDDEMPDADFGFDAVRARTRAAWSDALGVIEVHGGTPAERTAFATALYHAQHHPNVFNDVNGEYLGHDQQVHRVGEPGDPMEHAQAYYANFSMWDTYRAEMPLLAWIAPDRYRDMMRSIAAIIEHSEMPRWALMNKSPNYMNGEPGLQVIADGYCRGLVPPDALDTLYDEMVRVSLHDRRHPEFYERGFTAEASMTLEYALGDFALALVADARGDDATKTAALDQAGTWRNLLDPETRFMRPRRADGSWATPYYPEMPDGFREGTGWQYTWLVPHDVAGLFTAIGEDRGGEQLVLERLNTFFAGAAAPVAGPEAQQKATAFGIAYYGNQYAPSNEHDLQAPWLFNWTSQPWQTQRLQRAYQSLYRATPDGLPGNDDLGTMSAWFVWSALGLYPVTPGSPTYTIGSPLFERATVRPPGSPPFTIEAPGTSAVAPYVQEARLDHVPLERTWITHAALTGGATLSLPMGPAPSSWGADPGARPPSATGSPLADFACAP